jgi:hypothetical protein
MSCPGRSGQLIWAVAKPRRVHDKDAVDPLLQPATTPTVDIR